MSKNIETDILIIGSGLAGLLTAIKLLEGGLHVTLVCKTGLAESNSRYAQGGIAASASTNADKTAVPGVKTSIDAHLADTIKAGAGLVDEQVAREIISSSWQLIEQLSNYGVVFDHLPDGSYSLAREGGHSAARVYHHLDVTGTWICNGLINRLRSFNNLRILEHAVACDLFVKNGHCSGAILSSKEETMVVAAKHTILATGGIGQIFSRTTNPVIATGDGTAMAYRAGAELIDMEFVQFHPTALCLPGVPETPTVLISEAVRGAGAILVDRNNVRFMQRFDPSAELATRDIVARGMVQVMQETGSENVFLDLRPIGPKVLQENFPNILRQLKEHGINALEELIPVSPAAHYFMGGIRAAINGETSISSLYAIGECAATGLHGANRLASNSLLEAGVMALKAAQCIIDKKQTVSVSRDLTIAFPKLTIPEDPTNMRQIMFAKAGVIRDGISLSEAMTYLHKNIAEVDYSAAAVQTANLLLIAKLIVQSALRRQESRGAHYRSDYPQTETRFAARQVVYSHGIEDEYKWINSTDLCLSSPN